ncbi:hypothetical protein ACLMJK_006219 [Lecanora helva]
MARQQSEPIAIVGSGCRFPGGANSPSALWKVLQNPPDLSQEIPQDRFDTVGYYHPNGSHHGSTNVRHSYLLQEDIKVFDAGFFNISPNEADSIDPQQRLLLETVYEALEAGGHALEALRGSDTAVYVGTMGVDYNDTLLRDLNTLPTYFATGTNRAIISNRVSYFFDWHGPSMTIDTACSSSLIAVHQGVQALRSGESRVALACGTQAILGPEVFISESKLKMLSPTGRSRMWDADADGYARGEGVAAVVLKRLSDAIADGDHIECLIRETGANQDGATTGITVPSSEAQKALIRQTYAKAGLDLEDPRDRPQFFEAHGTGTKAGDPKEAAAIADSFGLRGQENTPLYVGSVKTVIGHTEGAAGLAGLLKGSEIIQNGLIPPNLLFNRLNPDIEPFYKGLHIPTNLTPWPKLPNGAPRRVSVNSFGFGGSNAHAILEEYRGDPAKTVVAPRDAIPKTHHTAVTPFVFSAVSETSLIAQLQAYSEYLKTHNDISCSDLAWTLQSRRSQLPFKVAFSAETLEQLRSKIDDKLAEIEQKPATAVGTRTGSKSVKPRILGVFTGQGAQWAAMGGQLIRSSDFVRRRVQDLEESLATLPLSDRPQWNLQNEMLAGADTSRISEAELSQPLCTALQIILVDLLRAAGITFSAVVGHSSGEIGAAYAADFVSDSDAIRIAYYRGLYARLAGAGKKGAMLAVGTSLEDAQDLVKLRTFKGRLTIAAHNSPASVTLSGDADSCILAKKVFDEEKKFARLLKVDTAYHSHHMFPCSDPYISSLRACGIRFNPERNSSCSWFSSVVPDQKEMNPDNSDPHAYWADNMTSAVLFADAVKNATSSDPQLSFAFEVGPHPALQGPAIQNISEVRPASIPYCGVLSRGKNDVQTFSDALGFAWTHAGGQSVDFQSYKKAMLGSLSVDASQPRLVVGLPSYQWNHGRIHWHESRRSRKARTRNQPSHELLGVLSPDSTAHDMRWSNLLRVSEIPWLEGHQLQSQVVFPAAGYVAMALEGARSLARDKAVELFELHDLSIPRAITFDEDVNSGVETLITLTAINTQSQDQTKTTTAEFSCYSCPSTGGEHDMELMASGKVKIVYGIPSITALRSELLEVSSMSPIDEERLYSYLSKLGYGYDGHFRGMSSIKRRLNQSSVLLSTYPYTEDESSIYLVHPTMLDVAFQASMLAYSAPGDERLWSLHVPTSIGSIRVNPDVCASLPTSGSHVPACAVLNESEGLSASIDLFSEDGQQGMVQVEDLTLKPFAPATKADDRRLFTNTVYDVAAPDGSAIIRNVHPTIVEIELANVCERISYYYVRKWESEITDDEWMASDPHYLHLRDFMNHTIAQVSSGRHSCIKKDWSNDTSEDVSALIERYSEIVDVKLLFAVGENMPQAVRNQTNILEHMLPNDMVDDFYKTGLGFAKYNSFLACMMKQVAHRYPHAKILEIGAGTGGATMSILESIGNVMSSYTYTDASEGFFDKAAKSFKAYSDRMAFKLLDVEKAPATQGFQEHSYDIIIASHVLHATASLQRILENTRRLLKPGGYLILSELTNNGPTRFATIMGGLPGWWLGVDDGRRYAPTITPGQWHTALRKAGFSGVETVTPEIDPLPWPFSIMAAQAVDDRVDFLRRPLSISTSSVSPYLEDVVILGIGSLESARIAEELEERFSRFCRQVTVLEGLPTEAEALTLNPMSTFINLADIDAPIFKDITAEKMDGLKHIFELARHILWVTVGAQADEPYHMASIAFNRVMAHEARHISLSHLDVSEIDHNSSKVIAEYLLRQCALDEWEVTGEGQKSQPLLWSKEPEVFLDRGQLLIPRVIGSVAQNARLNSAKRIITKTVPISSSNVSISQTSGSVPPVLTEDVLEFELRANQTVVKAESSTSMAIRVAADTFLFLGIGKEHASEIPVIVLSDANSSKTIPIARLARKSKIVEQSVNKMLIMVASELLATSLLETVSPGSSILVHCSGQHRFLAAALSRQAVTKAINVTFSCDEEDSDEGQDPAWLKLSARTPRHLVKKTLLPIQATHFLDLTLHSRAHPSNLNIGIAQVLSPRHKRIDPSELYQYQSLLPQSCNKDLLVNRLEDAASAVESLVPSMAHEQIEDLVTRLDQFQNPSRHSHPTSVVHWSLDGDVEVVVRPLDAKRLFSQNKTYLLVGMTGEIGQSVCEWMISNGAGCVCLTSRNPRINEKWLESFQRLNVTVKVLSLDVTNKQNLEKVVSDIRTSCPPIAGVMNGAMVLEDSLFSEMSSDTMQKVLRPKIDGTNNLDQIFNDDLDFFILFSSSACVIGNSGQTNYAAANGYLNSLARQRRKRGLAASAVDIGRMAGIGYVETARQAVVNQLTRFGLMPISESEFHQILAETIQIGYPHPIDKEAIPAAVVTTGIRTIRDDEDIQGPWFNNSRFSHCIIETENVGSGADQQNKKSMLPVNEQLSSAASMEEALEVLQGCFSAKLRVLLQISEPTLDKNTPLVELGIDSLVAVEVRSWFLKELKVDIPVLKVVGGASLAELCERVLEKLPKDFFKGTTEQKPSDPVLAQPQPQSQPVPPTPRQPDSSSGSDDGSSPDNSSASPPSTQLSSKTPSSENLAESAKLSAEIPAAAAIAKQPLRRFLKSERISFGQSRFWFLRRLLDDQTTFNVAFYYHVTGNLRIVDMERAVRIVTSRHEALRTCFVGDETEGDQAYQKVMSSSPFRLEHKKIKSVEDVTNEYAKLKSHVFDFETGDLVRLVLLSLSPSSHYLLINYHHILMDGVSFQIFLSDLEKAYTGQSLGKPAKQFPEFSASQRQAFEDGEMTDELNYWRAMFPANEELPVLPLLPMARTSSRVAMKNFDIHQVAHRLELRVVAQVKSISKAQRSTPFHFYLAAFKAMLFRFTDAKDLTIGIADANRNDSDVMSSIGFFLNLLTLRFRRLPGQHFADAISEARSLTYTALENSRLPFDVLLNELNVGRSSLHSPFFQAFFDYRQGAQEKQAFGNCQFEFQNIHPGRTAYDITLDVTDNQTDALIMFRAQKGLYDLTATNLLMDTYIHFVDILSSDACLSLEATPLFGEEQLAHATELGRGPKLISDWAETLPHRIDQIANENRDKVALMDGHGNVLTYVNMSSRIEAISEALQNAGIGIGSRVLVFQDARTDWVCSMLAIMRLGGIYVPLDLRNPMPRLAAVASDCKPSGILADSTTLENVSQLNVPYSHVIDVSSVHLRPSMRIPDSAQPEKPAAILYTSGSTGTPKGIMVTHRGLRNEIEGYTKMWDLGAERTLQQSAFTFNHSSDQMYTGLVNGGMVYVVPWSKRGDPLEITKIIQQHSITYTKATPSEYSLWMQYGRENLREATSWRRAFGGGEPLSSTIKREFADLRLPQLKVFNSYGPTEISISSTKMEIEYRDEQTGQDGRIPCGYSLPNYATYIVDEQLKPLPAGMPGEICLGGAGVSLGYLNNEELTNQHFVPDSFASPEYVANGWTRMYRTGDIGHLENDGAMVFHNRIAGDTQIKIRGLRLELCDIEANIVSSAGGVLREAVVTLREGDPDFLVAHVVFAPQQDIADKNAFLENLLSQLPIPQYMVPVAAIPLDKLPLTNHSKVDRKALRSMPLPQQSKNAREDTELTETMVQLKRIWQDVLGNKEFSFDITASTSFFLIGGNSLLVIRLQSRIRQVFSVTIGLVELLGAATLGHMARKVEESLRVFEINWENETTPPPIPDFLQDRLAGSLDRPKTKTLLVTGATGFLAKYLLPQLASNSSIGTIYCIAVRDKPSEGQRKFPSSLKIVSYTGDLASPLLGLSENEFSTLSSEVDVVLHMGAVRSFWDNYHVLRPSNVNATKELIKLAAPRSIPIHYISTVGVLPRKSIAEPISSASYPPAVDGSNGYVATRWASERILERSAQRLGVPATVYRFLPSTQQSSPKKQLDEFANFVDVTKKMPDLNGWKGRMDMVPATQAANWLCESILHDKRAEINNDSTAAVADTRFLHYESTIRINVDEMRKHLEHQRGGQGLERMPGLRWLGRIKTLGFGYLLTSQEATVGSKTEGEFQSRR